MSVRPSSQRPQLRSSSRLSPIAAAAAPYRVTLQGPGGEQQHLMCDEGKSVLEAALAANVDLPHLCHTGRWAVSSCACTRPPAVVHSCRQQPHHKQWASACMTHACMHVGSIRLVLVRSNLHGTTATNSLPRVSVCAVSCHLTHTTHMLYAIPNCTTPRASPVAPAPCPWPTHPCPPPTLPPPSPALSLRHLRRLCGQGGVW